MDQTQTSPPQEHFSFAHLGTIVLVAVFLFGAAWLKNPKLFSLRPAAAPVATVHYYAYVAPTDDQPQVLGDSTDSGPQIIGDDGTVQPVDAGQVLGAATQDVTLSTDNIAVNQIPDSPAAITKYFTDTANIENGPIDSAAFESALTSNDQNQINQQAQKLSAVVAALQKLPVPQSLVQLQKLTIVQYNSAVALLQNFTQADSDPTLVGQYLGQFLDSQQQLDSENTNVAQKFASLDPNAALYVDANGQPYATSSNDSTLDNSQTNLSTTQGVDDGSQDFDNSDNGDDGQ